MPAKRSPARAMAVGERMAAETLKRRKQAARARKQALAAHRRPVVRSIAARGRSALAPDATIQAASAGVVIAEGDSWFDYPLHDVLKDLEDLYGYDVESVAHKGDRVEDMAYAEGQLDEFSRRVEKVLRGGVKPKAILVSGGGNDIAGEELALLLNHASSANAGLNEDVVKGVIDQRLRDSYVTILGAITAICNSQIGEVVPILLHGYDYAVPDGRGFAGGWWLLPGPWLEPSFRRKGYAHAVRGPIVIELIDRFNAMLRGVSRIPEFEHVKYLDLRETLSTGPKYKEYWANELHPTAKGFALVTKRFAAAIG
jgi:hypothetical protein